MRTASLLTFIFVFSLSGFCQSKSSEDIKTHQDKISESKLEGTIILSLDTIFNKGIPYAVLKSKKKMFVYDYTLYSLKGNELVEITHKCDKEVKNCYYLFLFYDNGDIAEVKVFVGLKIYELIVENDLVIDTIINQNSKTKFLMKYPQKYSISDQQPKIVINIGNTNSNDDYKTVERNRNSMLQIFGKDIKQDFKLIGKVEKSTKSENGKILRIYSFYLPSGKLVAEATQVDLDSKSFNILTLKDNITRNITINIIGQESKELAIYLSKNYYL
ncbi:hypothetical protein JXM83_02480 [Candidatus Woesearchaeota archaeon]|nr:hypothetical protein [Candidatus Woesearchaeota archaeon]